MYDKHLYKEQNWNFTLFYPIKDVEYTDKDIIHAKCKIGTWTKQKL